MVDLSKATPRPWRAAKNGCVEVNNESPLKIATGWLEDAWFGEDGTDESRANAALIVTAVNSFDVMLEALNAIAKHIPNSTAQDGGPNAKSNHVAAADMVRKAIAIAEGAQ